MAVRKYSDRKAYLIRKVSERRQELRKKIVNVLGGKCIFCGYSSYVGALNAHHIDPSTKTFGLSNKGLCRSWAKILSELKKCVLLCSNCHAEIHAGLKIIPEEDIQSAKAKVEAAEKSLKE